MNLTWGVRERRCLGRGAPVTYLQGGVSMSKDFSDSVKFVVPYVICAVFGAMFAIGVIKCCDTPQLFVNSATGAPVGCATAQTGWDMKPMRDPRCRDVRDLPHEKIDVDPRVK